ncbi:hypothetical protein EJ08DRAFT_702530 [Tothia fuscella]|uniref:Uncharacterized protein n=1 Tax=Tothia fuscella TaxID=1048955 RepID=A0A9P4TTF5_9PEZI|nr:hypothetical protein EJ08DRAFT_702530 [Tothia fuscella]
MKSIYGCLFRWRLRRKQNQSADSFIGLEGINDTNSNAATTTNHALTPITPRVKTSKPFPFLALAGELRNQIYEHTFTRPQRVGIESASKASSNDLPIQDSTCLTLPDDENDFHIIDCSYVNLNTQSLTVQERCQSLPLKTACKNCGQVHQALPGILSVNKQIRAEALELFLKFAAFELQCPLDDWASRFLTGKSIFSNIRYLKFDNLGPDNKTWSAFMSQLTQPGHYAAPIRQYHAYDIMSLCSQLRELSILFKRLPCLISFADVADLTKIEGLPSLKKLRVSIATMRSESEPTGVSVFLAEQLVELKEWFDEHSGGMYAVTADLVWNGQSVHK